jgi:glycosyltransferase involved in cell wall biosynthesis
MNNVNSTDKSEKSTIFIYHNLPPGGALETVNQLTNSLIKQKIQYEIITGVQIQPKNILSYLYSCVVRNFIHDFKLSKKIGENDNLIIFQSWLIKTPYIGALCKPKTKIYVCHEPPREYYDVEYIAAKSYKEKLVDFLRLPIKYIDLLNARSMKAVFVANSITSSEAIRKIYKKDSIVIYPGITVARKFGKKSWNKTQRVILSVGSDVKTKRFDLIIRAIGRLPKEIRPKYKVVGCNHNKHYVKYLNNLALNNNVDFTICTCVSKSELVKEYYSADVFCFAPINEPFGIAVIDAIYLGVPIIVYANGSGFKEVINTHNGELMESLDESEWAKIITEYISNQKLLEKISEYNLRTSLYLEKNDFGGKLINLLRAPST